MSLGIGEDIMARECLLDWKLTMFFVECGKNIIRQTHVRIVFNLFLAIVEERNLASPDSQDILICDILMEKFIDMPHCHLTQLRDCIMKYLTFTDSPSRRVQNPTDDYKVMTNRLYPPSPPGTNTGGTALPGQVAQQEPYVSLTQVLWVMNPDLSLFLIGFVSSQPVAYDFILTLVTQYISNNRQRLLHPKNMDIAYIRHDGLYNIFHCSYIHRSQVRGILRDHVSPVVED